ncbi:acid phosphatase 1-like [Pistacia vera]|uniref:acid phosphatase 1-like n=1 Tax=Pistacia vera TaxID=55513 RepID=UPI00126375C9|nr:acid phosphatase 1-like [Pistacia vera]
MRTNTVPKHKNYLNLKHYMLGHHSQYMRDSRAVAKEALRYAKSLKLAGDGNDIWIFDIDDTLISHLPYFANHGLGTEPINLTSFIEWMNKSKAPALPASLQLYRELLSLGFKIVLLTGRPEEWRMATVTNLKKVGYHTWEKLILKSSSYPGNITLQLYKSIERRKLEEINGYRIIGNMGDQWSDISGIHPGNRTFKLPNPMYNIS